MERENYMVIEVRDGAEVLSEPGFYRTDWKAAKNFANTCYEVRDHFGTQSVKIRNGKGVLLYEIDENGDRWERETEEYGPCSNCGDRTSYVEDRTDEDGFHYCQPCIDASEVAEAEYRAYGKPY